MTYSCDTLAGDDVRRLAKVLEPFADSLGIDLGSRLRWLACLAICATTRQFVLDGDSWLAFWRIRVCDLHHVSADNMWTALRQAQIVGGEVLWCLGAYSAGNEWMKTTATEVERASGARYVAFTRAALGVVVRPAVK